MVPNPRFTTEGPADQSTGGMGDLPQPDKLLQIVSMAAVLTAVLFIAASEAQDGRPAPDAVAGGSP
jgi:hypothetical protein